MEFKRKRAYSYLELIVVMLFVVVIMFISTPLLTHTSKKTNSVYGEFRCYAMYDTNKREYRLYQQHRYNTDSLSSPIDVTSSGCVFEKPSGVTLFNVTAIGGGGGGSAPYIDNNVAISQSNDDSVSIDGVNIPLNQQKDIQSYFPTNALGGAQSVLKTRITKALSAYTILNGYYNLYKLNSNNNSIGIPIKVNQYSFTPKTRSIPFYVANGGGQGEIVTRSGGIDFGSNNSITIAKCKNYTPNSNYSSVDSVNESYYCVGEGGLGGDGSDLAYYNLGIKNLHGYIKNYKDTSYYYKINFSCDEINKITSSTYNSKNCDYYANPLRSSADKKKFYNNFLYKIMQHNNTYAYNNLEESTGYDGRYTRFKLKNNFDILAKGGSGGVSSASGGTKNIRNNTTEDFQSTEKTNSNFYYFFRGENGLGDLSYNYNGTKMGQGGLCIIKNGTLNQSSCNGGNSTLIGAGGGGGGIGFKLRTNYLSTFVVAQFFNVNSEGARNAYASYNISGNDETIETLTLDGTNKNIYRGNGGNGGGGAVIITW